MAHIALIAPPYVGHTTPMLAIAGALVARGHQATFLHTGPSPCPPAGVATLRLELPPRPVPFSPLEPVRLTARRTASLLEVLPDTLRALGADLVAADQLEPAGALAAARLGLPWVSVACALPVNREPGVPPPFTPWRHRPDLLARWRNRVGWQVHDLFMRPLSRVIATWAAAHGLTPRALDDTFSPWAQISQMVRGLDFPRRALPATFHYVGPIRAPAGTGTVPPALAARPLVFASLGTLQGHRADLFGAIAAAADACGVDLLIAHGGRLPPEAVATLPGVPEVHDFVPQREVLARAAALVGHGGMNTVMDAIAAGVPAVLVPLAFEQAAIAARAGADRRGTGGGRPPVPRPADRRGAAARAGGPRLRGGGPVAARGGRDRRRGGARGRHHRARGHGRTRRRRLPFAAKNPGSLGNAVYRAKGIKKECSFLKKRTKKLLSI
ncbi:MAG: glycosyltransferase [Thermomicrobiales bacterium]